MPVFRIDRNYKIMLNPEAAKLVPELQSLSENQLWYVILVIDYVDGPFRKKPLEERRILAARKVFDRNKVIESQKVKNAMESYKGLVFDIRRETVDALKKKVKQLYNQLMDPSANPTQIAAIDKSISFLEKRISSIEHDLDIEEQEFIELKANRELSMMEKWQRNQHQFHEYQSESI